MVSKSCLLFFVIICGVLARGMCFVKFSRKDVQNQLVAVRPFAEGIPNLCCQKSHQNILEDNVRC